MLKKLLKFSRSDPERKPESEDWDWYQTVPSELQISREEASELIARGFSSRYYSVANPDVAKNGMDPKYHFLRHGWLERRLPNGLTNPVDFLAGVDESKKYNHFFKWAIEQDRSWSPEEEKYNIKLDFAAKKWCLSTSKFLDNEDVSAFAVEHVQALKEVFDADYYLGKYPDVVQLNEAAFIHFLQYGWAEGRAPNAQVGVKMRERKSDLRETVNAMLEIQFGNPDAAICIENLANAVFEDLYANVSQQGSLLVENNGKADYIPDVIHKTPGLIVLNDDDLQFANELFDEEYYLSQVDDLEGLDPLSHFLEIGWQYNFKPSIKFDPVLYKKLYADIAKNNINPFAHYVKSGKQEGRIAHRKDVKRLGLVERDIRLIEEIFDKKQVSVLREYFDEDFYLEQIKSLQGLDPLTHYFNKGYLSDAKPSKRFDPVFYRKRYEDVGRSDWILFEHFLKHGLVEARQGSSYLDERAESFNPSVSIIVPNYNHARFLRKRFESIATQTYRNFELIILDDNSSDESISVIREWIDKGHDFEIKTRFNRKNKGNVFRQWETGLKMARGDLIWICESDDFCDPEFLEHLIPYFVNKSVSMAFGRIEFVDTDGEMMAGMQNFREASEPGIWERPLVRPAAAWFKSGFSVNNVIANVGGCVFRNVSISKDVFEAAQTFKIAGDWYLYSHLASGGQIAFNPNSVAYFRQHEKNTSASNFGKLYYYQELGCIRNHLRSVWDVPEDTDTRFINNVERQWKNHKMKGDLLDRVPLLKENPLRRARHIVMGFLGPYMGGGELIALNLANSLSELSTAENPIFVSLLASRMTEANSMVESRISPRVTLYSLQDTLGHSPWSWARYIGADIIHSHIIGIDNFFFKKPVSEERSPYIVTLHGSYDGEGAVSDPLLINLLRGVDIWCSTTERNLGFLSGIPLDPKAICSMPNAMPKDDASPPFDRASLNISEDAFVFSFVARGIQRKGWRVALMAFRDLLARNPNLDAHLLMIGEGDIIAKLPKELCNTRNVHFLGMVTEINGVYRMSDCALVPSRFGGESYPLCLVQALMEGRPAISTDIGSTRLMMTNNNDKVAGILLEEIRNTEDFAASVSDAMESIMNVDVYKEASLIARDLGPRYSMKKLAEKYLELYNRAEEIYEEK